MHAQHLTADGIGSVRTPESRFGNLPDWPYPYQYVEIDGLRQAYVEAGPADGEVVLLLTDHCVFEFWADGRTNDEDLNIYMAKVNLNSPATGVQELGPISQQISISAPYPVPASEEIFMDIKLEKAYCLLASVMEVSGRTLWSSNWQEYVPGTYQLNVPLDQLPGTFLVQIRSDHGYFKAFRVIKK